MKYLLSFGICIGLLLLGAIAILKRVFVPAMLLFVVYTLVYNIIPQLIVLQSMLK